MTTRTIHCSRCHRDLPTDHFRPARVTPTTKRDRCKKCLSELSRAWNLAHPERYAANKAAHRPKELARMREFNRENRPRLTEYMRRWRDKNRERVREINATVRRTEEDKAKRRARCAKRGSAIPPWADRKAIQALYLKARRLRKQTGIDWHVDHIIPLNAPNVCGLHVETNLQIIRGIDNLRKGNRVMGACT